MRGSANKMDIIACVAVQVCLDGMGGSRPKDLYDDLYTWIDAEDLQMLGFTMPEAKGYLGAMERRGWYVPGEGDESGFITEECIDRAERVWDEIHGIARGAKPINIDAGQLKRVRK